MSFAYEQITEIAPPSLKPGDVFANELRGTWYIDVMEQVHRHYKPRSYFEIGTLAGESLRLSRCASVAVDPQFQLAHDVMVGKPSCALYQCGSDAFFADQDLKALFGRPVDLAFLDGMHWFEYLLRDFANTEVNCSRNSIVVLHDCIPTDCHMARRDHGDSTTQAQSRHPDSWAGDVWKVVSILQKYRPDLRIHAFDAPPTGLIMVTGLNPTSRVLQEHYFAIMAEFATLTLQQVGIQNYIDSLNMKPAALLATQHEFSQLFWR